MLFKLAMFRHERHGQLAQAYGFTAGHGFQYSRKQILLFVFMVVSCRSVKVPKNGLRCLLSLRVAAVQRQVRLQSLQGLALFFYARVAGGQHVQRGLRPRSRTAETREGCGDVHGAMVRARLSENQGVVL